MQVTVSVGMALSIDYQDHTADEIIQEADKALYAAKPAGRNCVRIAIREDKDRAQQEAFEGSGSAPK